MKKALIFKGTATALVTPFCGKRIDYPALDRLLDTQLTGDIDALVVGGTTAEAATLSNRERYALYRYVKEKIDGRVKLILGVGSNDTKAALSHIRAVNRIGCDGVLSVTPYYNKGTEDGIVSHYLAQAEYSEAPLLLYNVPGRTGVNLTIEQLTKLSEHENVVGIKEASDSADRLIALATFGENLPLYAGNDSHIYSVLSLGGAGVISVASGAFPRRIGEIAELYREGRHDESRQAQLRALPLCRALFAETNPVPVKYLLSLRSLCREDVRLPLSAANENTRRLLRPFAKEADTRLFP